MDSRARIAAAVRAEIARHNKRQVDIAAMLGLPQSVVSRRLAGLTEFSGSELAALSTWLDIPIGRFYDESAQAAS